MIKDTLILLGNNLLWSVFMAVIFMIGYICGHNSRAKFVIKASPLFRKVNK